MCARDLDAWQRALMLGRGGPPPARAAARNEELTARELRVFAEEHDKLAADRDALADARDEQAPARDDEAFEPVRVIPLLP